MVPVEALVAPLQSGGIVDTVGSIGVLLFQIAIVVAEFAGLWRIFTKADYAGWKALIPLYNYYVMLEIGDNAWWWILLLIIPVVNLYALYKIHAGVARAFGRGIGFGLGLTFLSFLFCPLIGFGDYQYQRSKGLT